MDIASIANARESSQIKSPMDMDIPKSEYFCSDCLKSNTMFRCERCECRFVHECATNRTPPDDGDFKQFNMDFIPNILAFIMVDKQFEPIMEMKFNEEQILNAEVLLKMQTKSYETVKQFEDDVKWFVRHCRSIDPVSEEPNAAEKLIKNVKDQIETINACATCYQNVFDDSTKGSVEDLCTNRHVLLWAEAQEDQLGYWPAKVLTANAVENTVLIQYFGNCSCYSLPAKDKERKSRHYVYSWKNPCEDKSARTKEYLEARRDAKEYITNIRLMYDFNYAKLLTAFEPGKLNEHWNQMFVEKRSRGETDESSTSESDSSYDSPSSDSSTLDSEYIATEDERITKSMRKRNANRSCRNGLTMKRNRFASDVNEADEADEDNIVDIFENSFKQGIVKLKHDLEKLKNEKKAAEETNATLIVEKDSLEQTIASLNESQRKEKRKATDDRNALKTKIAELEESQRKQKEASDQEKDALEKMNVELEEKHCTEAKKWTDEKKTLTERHIALQSVKDQEKKTLEAENRALVEKNAALKIELDNQKKKSADSKRHLAEAIRCLN